MDGLTKSYLDILHSLIQQILSVIHNHFHLQCLAIMSIIGIFLHS